MVVFTSTCSSAPIAHAVQAKEVDGQATRSGGGTADAQHRPQVGEAFLPLNVAGANALVPFLDQGMRASPSELLFSRADGSMWSENEALGEKLRSAMGRAGIVECYRHACRRCKAGRKPDCEERHPAMLCGGLRRCKTRTPRARLSARSDRPPEPRDREVCCSLATRNRRGGLGAVPGSERQP